MNLLVTRRDRDAILRRVYQEDTDPYCHIYIPVEADIGRSRVTVTGGTMTAYQALWIYEHGPIPEGLFLLHSCDRGHEGCVNLEHLRLGTPSENVQDALERGRWSNGQREKDTCPKGHPYDEQNTRIRPNGQRACRACDRQRWHERKR